MIKNVKNLLLCLLLLAGAPLLAQQNFDSPVAYLNAMGNEHQAINKDMWRYINAMAHGKSGRKVENRRKEVLATIKKAQTNISRLPAYKGDRSLRDSVSAYLKLSYQVMNEDYAKIVDLEEIAEQSYDAMEAYMMAKEQANLKLDLANERVNAQQQTFANQHGVRLVEGQSKLGAKLERAGHVFEYLPGVWRQSVYPMAERLGVDIQLPSVSPQPYTHLAFEGYQYAKEKGKGEAYTLRMFEAFFKEDKNIGHIDVLTQLAGEVGLDKQEYRKVLANRTYQQTHRQELEQSYRLGIQAVPTFKIGDHYYPGVLPKEQLKKLIQASVTA